MHTSFVVIERTLSAASNAKLQLKFFCRIFSNFSIIKNKMGTANYTDDDDEDQQQQQNRIFSMQK